MSGAFYRQNLPSLRDKLTASVKADQNPGDSALFAAITTASLELDGIDRTMFERVNSDAPAANYLLLDSIRRVADDLRIAADSYQWRRS